MLTNPGRLIGQGVEAEVFATDEGHALKLMRSPGHADRLALEVHAMQVTRWARAAGEFQRHAAWPTTVVDDDLPWLYVGGRDQRVHLGPPGEHLPIGVEVLLVDLQPVIAEERVRLHPGVPAPCGPNSPRSPLRATVQAISISPTTAIRVSTSANPAAETKRSTSATERK